jgi:hypothetical protein
MTEELETHCLLGRNTRKVRMSFFSLTRVKIGRQDSQEVHLLV